MFLVFEIQLLETDNREVFIEYRKIQTKVVTLTTYSTRKQRNDQSEFEANACNRRQARENTCNHVMIAFWFSFSLVEKVARVLLTNHGAR